MISATLLGMLGKFTAKEFKDFGEFVKSPFSIRISTLSSFTIT